jgi:aldose sugar dehydrogenase
MTARRPLLALLCLAPLAAACGSSPSGGGPTAPASSSASPAGSTSSTQSSSSSASPDACAVRTQSLPTAPIAASFPTALAFAPDGRLFYAERGGTVRVWQDGAAHLFATVPTVTAERGGGYSERGLLGLAISPTYAKDHYVFAFFSDVDYSRQHVIRWTDCAGKASDAKVIVTLPAGPDCCHKGGRLAAGPDGKLYVTLGDEHTSSAAQDTGDRRGKVLRYNLDGSVPADNPFGGSNPVWAYGFRNPFGIAFSASAQLAVDNNGPSGDSGSPGTGYDTVIASVRRGGGYQWPLCYGYGHPLASSNCGGKPDPDWSSESSTVVPTGMAFVDASGPSAFAGHLVLCSFNRGMLILTPGSPHATVAAGPKQCMLDVKQGPDHAVYYADTGHIYRQG